MPIKKVFLSSTARDLKEYREAAYRAIEGLDGYHCVRMEDFGARDWGADDFCRARVAECDLLVGIVGHLYGSCPEGNEKSYTEREYEAAVDVGMSRLMFVAPEDFPVPADLFKHDGKWEKQDAFRKRINKDRIKAEFTSPENLAMKITQAIHNWEPQQVRCSEPPHTEDVVHLRPYFAHPYPLQKNFTGRVKERQILTRWLTEGQEPILGLIAMGGMGKSALTWVWLNHDVLRLNLPGVVSDSNEGIEPRHGSDAFVLEGVLWWSFYEREANFIKFLDEALVYVSSGSVNLSEIRSTYEKLRKLISLLQERQILIVLDGFERELCAYASLNAAYQGDDVEEDEKGDFRTCTERYAADFLRQMVALPPKSRLLLTSRLFPRELDGMAGCRRLELDHLDHNDAVNFFRAHEIEGTRAQIQEACEPYEYHPLALRLLVGMILNDPVRPKDIIVASEYDPIPDLIPRENHIFDLAYNALQKNLQELLSRLSAFRSSVDYESIKLLSPFEMERELKMALSELVERGLLLFNKDDEVRYDFHRIVRSCAYERLANKVDIHLLLRDYFATNNCPVMVTNLDELLPLIELYHHTIGAGRYDEACNLFHQKLEKPLDRLGAYQISIKLLRALFPSGEDLPPNLNEKPDQNRVLNALAVAYVHSGQSRRAASLWEIALPLEAARNTTNFAIGLGNLGYNQIVLGELKSANENLQRKIELCHKIGNKLEEAGGHLVFSRIMVYMGLYGKALQELNILRKLGLEKQCLFYAYQTFKILLTPNLKLKTLKAGLKTAHNSLRYANLQQFEHQKIYSEWLLGATLVSFAYNNEIKNQNEWLAEAESHMEVALKGCKQINLVELESDILLTWARWHYKKGDVDQALRDAEEALYIADRYEYRLSQAEIHNFLAGLLLEAKDAEGAKSHAKTAYERAWCDGPPYCYKPALDEAKEMLRKLGAKPPKVD